MVDLATHDVANHVDGLAQQGTAGTIRRSGDGERSMQGRATDGSDRHFIRPLADT
jgi:hypothetical protein